MMQLSLASWRQHGRRYVATFLAIVLGVGFCAATLSLTAAARRGAGDAAAIQYNKADVVAFPGGAPADALVRRLSALADVEAAGVVRTALLDVRWPAGHAAGAQQVSEIPGPVELRWQQLESGHFPAGPGEVAVDEGLAADKGVSLGSRITVGGGSDAVARSVVVVGLVGRQKGADGISPIFVSPGALDGWGTAATTAEVAIAGADGVSPDSLATQVRRVAPAAAVSTADQLRQQAVSGLTNEVDVLGRFLQGFALVALFVAGLVIANTFRIVMTQRLQDLALLRCVGAERWQIFTMTAGEASLLGVVASAVGVASGVAFGAGLVEVLNRTAVPVALTSVAPALSTLLLPFAGGVVVAVVAALAPALWAARVTPLAALRTGDQDTTRSKAGALRASTGLLMGLVGAALIGLGVMSGQLFAGLAGGLASFVGIMVLTPFLVPWLIRLTGGCRRVLPRRLRGGVPAELSVLNAVRNPHRTAAASGALLVGVTLISMMSVGAASVSATESDALDRVAPVDVTVSGGAVPAGLAQRARHVDGVVRVVVAHGTRVRTAQGRVEVASLTPAQAAAVVRDPALRDAISRPVGVVVPVKAQEILPGGGTSPVVLRSDQGRVRAQPTLSNLGSGPLLVAPSMLRLLGGPTHPVALYIKVSDSADPQTVVSGLQDAIGSGPSRSGLLVDGGFGTRSTYDRAVSVMLLVATAMLGMAVLIALVGVGNTLSLSVLERTREHGLLRALGLTTRQLRLLLASEAALMAGVAALLGTALGVAYGWAGTLTLLHGVTDQGPILAVPVGRLCLVVAVALIAGLLASVLPARRAARLSPTEALSCD